MPSFAVKTHFRAFDKFSPVLKKMGANAKIFGVQASASMQRVNKSTNKMLKTMGKFSLMAAGIGAGLIVKEFIEMDDAIVAATARFKAAEKPGTDMVKVMANLRKEAMNVAKTTKFTGAEMAKGLDKFALAGFTSAEAMKVLRSQAQLATVTGEDFMRVADISSDLLGGFGGAALKSAEKVKMLKKMNGLLAVATLSANVTMENMFETLKSVGPIAKLTGKSMEDVIAATSVLGSAGIKGTEAATALKNIFLRLVKPTAGVTKALKAIKLEQSDFIAKSGKMKSTVEIFSLIAKSTKGLSDVKVAAVFKELAGLRGIAGGAVLSKNIGEMRKQLIRMAKDPQKAMAETAKFIESSLGNKLKILWSAISAVGAAFITGFAGKGKKGITDITKAIGKLEPIFTKAGKAVNVLIGYLPALIAGFTAFKVVMIGIAIATGVISWIPLAVAAAVTAAILLYKNWDLVSKKFMEFTKIFDNPIFATFALIFASWITIPILIARNFNRMKESIMGAVNWIKKSGLGRLLGFGKNATAKIEQNVTSKSTGFPQSAPNKMIAPNLEEARSQRGLFEGTLNIANAPAGSTVSVKSRNSGIDMNLLGQN